MKIIPTLLPQLREEKRIRFLKTAPPDKKISHDTTSKKEKGPAQRRTGPLFPNTNSSAQGEVSVGNQRS